MPAHAAARLGDRGSHGGMIITGAEDVLVNGKPFARMGDIYDCANSNHSPNPIADTSPSASSPGRQAARVGLKTRCGATLIEGSPDVFIGDNVIIGGTAKATNGAKSKMHHIQATTSVNATQHNSNVMPRQDTQHAKNSRYEYCYEIDEKFHIAEYANILAEGSGILHPGASFSLEGIIRMESQDPPTLLVTCAGRTAIGTLATSITFWAKASLEKKGTLIQRKGLTLSQHGYIRPYPDTSYIIGEATFILPEPADETSLTLTITGSYFADLGAGSDVPFLRIAGIPHVIASKSFQIISRRKIL